MSGRPGHLWHQMLPGGLIAFLLLATIAPPGATGVPLQDSPGESPFIHPEVHAALRADPALIQEAIVTHKGDPDSSIRAFEGLGLQHHTLPKVGASLVRLPVAALDALAQDPTVRGIWPNAPIELYLENANTIINATSARQDHDVTGQGVGVLVIDTGVDGLHPDLAPRLMQNVQPILPFESSDAGFVEDIPFNDWFGHGTHVAGVLAGTGEGLGSLDPNHGRFIGIAPGVDLISFSLSSPINIDTPLGNTWTALNGFEYALQEHEELNIRIISNSWGSPGDYAPDHPINIASLKAYQEGMAVLFAAGNEGENQDVEAFTMNIHATMEWVLGIAGSHGDAQLAYFSSRGQDPETSGRDWEHPTVTAPAVSIMASKSRAGVMQAYSPTYADEPPGEPVAQATHYQYSHGTSMATPMVAGTLALMLEANDALAPDQLYDIIVKTAKPFGDYDYWEQGAGMLDAHAAVAMALDTPGTRDAFLQGERRYDEPFVHENEPLKRFLQRSEGTTTATDAPDPREASELAGPPLVLLLITLGATGAIAIARRKTE